MEDQILIIDVATALLQVAESTRDTDKNIIALVKEVIIRMDELEHRISELELLTRIVTTKPQ